MSLYIVITTIQKPTACVERLIEKTRECAAKLVVAGDVKGPSSYDCERTKFLSYQRQLTSGFALAEALPTKHYARKNIGYLEAIREGATCIYETDDDNAPTDSWQPRSEQVTPSGLIPSGSRWVNVYSYFSQSLIWPRGLPLDQIHVAVPELLPTSSSIQSPIQQGLVDLSPDVDAIWRLVFDKPFTFPAEGGPSSVTLLPGNWCPFNTQTTWWWPAAYPLLYIPSYCSFRMCDIWKSFVAQRCLWAMGLAVTFHQAEVYQERNFHDLNKDFADEISGYLKNQEIRTILEGVTLRAGHENTTHNLRECYVALVAHGILPAAELNLVDLWIRDLEAQKRVS